MTDSKLVSESEAVMILALISFARASDKLCVDELLLISPGKKFAKRTKTKSRKTNNMINSTEICDFFIVTRFHFNQVREQ